MNKSRMQLHHQMKRSMSCLFLLTSMSCYLKPFRSWQNLVQRFEYQQRIWKNKEALLWKSIKRTEIWFQSSPRWPNHPDCLVSHAGQKHKVILGFVKMALLLTENWIQQFF